MIIVVVLIATTRLKKIYCAGAELQFPQVTWTSQHYSTCFHTSLLFSPHVDKQALLLILRRQSRQLTMRQALN